MPTSPVSRRRLLVLAGTGAAAAATFPLWGRQAAGAKPGASGAAVGEPAAQPMRVGSNFWYLADDGQCVAGGNPWTGERPFRAGVDWSGAYSFDPATRLSRTNVWNPVFLDEIGLYRCLRFMDWGKTNLSPITSWSARTPVTADQTRVGGVEYEPTSTPGLAYEWMIDLCNRLGTDAWICLPLKADDDYFRRCAALFRDRLDPALRVHVELHNELWLEKAIHGDGRSTTDYAVQQANNGGYGTGDPADFANVLRFLAHRSAELWAAWSQVYGAGAAGRVVRVIAGQAANPGYGRQVLQALDDRGVNPGGLYPDAYAIAPYFGHDVDATAPDLWEQLDAAVLEQSETTRQNHAVWSPRGIELVGYEGGQHLVGDGSAAASRDWHMHSVYMRYLSEVGQYCTLFNHYTHCGSYGASGSWGAKEETGQQVDSAHKYRALRDWINL